MVILWDKVTPNNCHHKRVISMCVNLLQEGT